MTNPFSTLEISGWAFFTRNTWKQKHIGFLIIFQIMEYLFIHNKMSWGWDSGLNMDLIYFFCIYLIGIVSCLQPEGNFNGM